MELINNKHSPNAKTFTRWWVLFAICLFLFMINVDYTALHLILPTIARDIDVKLSLAQWLLSIYVLTWGAFTVISGRISDHWDPKKLCLIGLGIFTLGSVVVVLSKILWIMLVGRILQGLGGALFIPCTYAILHQIFPKEQHGLTMGFFGAAVGIGLAFGPSFAGYLTYALSWPWVFWINVPLSIIAFLILYYSVPSMSRTLNVSLDYISAFLLVTGLMSLMITLNQLTLYGLQASEWWLILLTLISISLFSVRQSRLENPFVPFELFRDRPYVSCLMAFTIQQFVTSSSLFLLSYSLQLLYGQSILETAITMSVMTLVYGLLSPFGGYMVDKMDMRIPTTFSLLLLALGALVYGFDTWVYRMGIAMLLFGIGLGVSFASLNASLMKVAPKNLIATASSLFVMFATIGHTLAYILTTGLLKLLTQQELFILLSQKGVENAVSITNHIQDLLNYHIYMNLFSNPSDAEQLPIAIWYAIKCLLLGNVLLCVIAIGFLLIGFRKRYLSYQAPWVEENI